jgi:hypothetical protein
MNARYYSPYINRFISADTIVPNPARPQGYNRYSYGYNNPLFYVDPSGHCNEVAVINGNEETLVRDTNDSLCWGAYDSLASFMQDNPAYAEAWGWDPAEYEGKSFKSCNYPYNCIRTDLNYHALVGVVIRAIVLKRV